MRKEVFCDLLGEIREDYVYQARQASAGRDSPWVRWGLTACAAAAVVAVCLLSGNSLRQEGVVSLPGSGTEVTSGGQVSAAPEVDLEQIAVNELEGMLDASRVWYDPELYRWVEWDEAAVEAYYGGLLSPSYIPEGLTAAPGNGRAVVIVDEAGQVREDSVWLSYYHAYYEDGSPKLTEGVAAPKGFQVKASKLGLLGDCLYLMPEDEVQTSQLCGTEVTVGHRSMSYGPYDLQTHAPAGYYDLYVIEFEREGIAYQIVAEQMELEEVVKVAASMLQTEG